MAVTAAPVARPLASVKKTMRAGHVVVFDEEGSFLMNKATGEIKYLREELLGLMCRRSSSKGKLSLKCT